MNDKTYLHVFSLEYGFQHREEPCSEKHINDLFPMGNFGYGTYSYEKDRIPQVLLDKVHDALEYKLEEVRNEIETLKKQEVLYKKYQSICESDYEKGVDLDI